MSASSVFAADDDNATLSETDEIAVEETIGSVEVTDDAILAEDAAESVAADGSANEEIISNSTTTVETNITSNEVTNETFHNYFDESGCLLVNVTSDELIFNGDFEGIGVDYITIDRPIKLTGHDAVLEDICFVIMADDVTVDGFTLSQSKDVSLFNVGGTNNVTLSNNLIEFYALDGFGSYAIYANAVSALNIINNTIAFFGNTAGNAAINNVIRIEGDEYNEESSESIFVNGNTFDITIPSVDVNYDYWPDTITYSEGIVFYYCNDVEFCDNVINLNYNDVVTKYGADSIYVVSVKGNPYSYDADGPIECNNVLINNNTINAVGHSYIYGISVAANNVEISDNVLNISSEGAYANGITVNGPSNGEVVHNEITLASNGVTYGIYSSQYDGAIMNMTYSYNTVAVDSYFACGMELMERNPVVVDNVITAAGNHTSGIIASISGNASIKDNKIYSLGNNIGTDPTGDSLLPLNSLGISIKGEHVIENNTIEATSIGINLVENGPSNIVNNNISVIAVGLLENYGIYAFNYSNIRVANNNIRFVGSADGKVVNNAIRIIGDEKNENIASSIAINENVFDIVLPSVDVNYDNWPDTVTYSEGILFYYCGDAGFSGNVLNVSYNGVFTSFGYDSIYVVSVRGNPYNYEAETPIACHNIVIDNNTINAVGHSYIYGISVSSREAEITDNILNISSDGAYANGISINGPANGEVVHNEITLASNEVTYGIYSAQYDGTVGDLIYSYNTVAVDSYFACGMELMEKNPIVNYNVITATGNHTSGIVASISGNALIKDNKIYSLGNNIGTTPTSDDLLPLNSLGISIKGKHVIDNNTIEASSIGINLVENGPSTISNNNISVVAVGLLDNYGIYAFNYSDINIVNNNIGFVGSADGMVFNNAIRVMGDEKKERISSNITINGNVFDIVLPSVDVNYDNWPYTITYSEGVLFYYCEDVEFSDNVMDVDYNGVFTSYGYDSIYVIGVRGNPYNWDAEDPIACYNVAINNNTITGIGHAYIYGIFVAAEDVEISDNVLDLYSEGVYANGITVNGPSNGDVVDNNITLAAGEVVYGICSAQYDGAIMDMTYSGNIIDVNSYFACGMELMERNPVVVDNVITAAGNHTSGIVASISGNALIKGNKIYSLGNNIGTNLTGDDLLPLNSLGISIKGKHVIEDNTIEATSIGIDLVENGPSTISNNNISVIAVGSLDNYGIYAFNCSDISVIHNNIKFVGASETLVFNNAVRIEGYEKKEYISSNITINDNTFDIVLPSVDVNYDNWPDTITYSEGVLFYYCEDVEFAGNVINLTYNGFITKYGTDSIYVISVRGNPYNWDAEDPIACYDVAINNNTINAVGHAYIYGISAAAEDVEISENVLNITSDGYYANGIAVNGPSNGDVVNNNITLAANGAVYGIYSAQYDGAVADMTYSGNIIVVDSYAACGMELMERNPVVVDNKITATGNYTYGIVASISGEAQISNNEIYSLGNNVGTTYTGDDLLPLNSIGVSTKGSITLSKNNISSTDIGVKTFETVLSASENIIDAGDYAVVLDNKTNATFVKNSLTGNKGAGNNAIAGGNTVYLSGNTPLDAILMAFDLTKVYGDGQQFAVMLIGQHSDALVNKTITLSIGNVILSNVTDEKGVARFDIDLAGGNYTAVSIFAGDVQYGFKSTQNSIIVKTKQAKIVSTKTVSVLLTAIKKGYYYKITLKDASGKVLANKKVKITFNGKTYTKTTNSKGLIKFKLSATKVGNKKLTMKFAGDENYTAVTSTATIKITKEATKLTVPAASFNVNTKTKVVKVTLKDSKNKGVGGAKITLRVNGVNYVAKTISSGVAAVKITKLTKVGSFTASVKFAGNNYYKAASKSIKIAVKK